MDDDPIAAYPDISADMPGVQLDRSLAIPSPTATPTTTTTSDPDWAQLAEEAIHNADLGEADPLPPAPEVIIVDDEDDIPLPLAGKKMFSPLPKIEPDLLPTTQIIPQPMPSSRNHQYPTRICSLSTHLKDYHMFTTVAEDTYIDYPYCDAGGKTVDLAINYENMMAQCDASYCGIHFHQQSQQQETIQIKSRSLKVCFTRQHCNYKRVDTTTHN